MSASSTNTNVSGSLRSSDGQTTPAPPFCLNEELDKLVESWTVNYPPEEVMEKLQQGGVSAGVVQNIEDLLRDPHLWERGFLVDLKLPHPERKPPSVTLPGVITRFSSQSLTIRRPAPDRIGQPNDAILKDRLGMTQAEIDRAAAAGAFD